MHVDSYKFEVKKKMQFYAEIFNENYLYDMDMYLRSPETSLVREHIYNNKNDIDWSFFKGAKKIYIDLEPGLYELSIL